MKAQWFCHDSLFAENTELSDLGSKFEILSGLTKMISVHILESNQKYETISPPTIHQIPVDSYRS
jgi:hypothetical protein